MLFESWQDTLARNGDAVALREAGSALGHSFADLQRRVDGMPRLERCSRHVVPVRSGVLEFLVQTLRAWRDGAVLCPVEREGSVLPQTSGLPEGVIHLKLTSGSTGEPRCVMFRPEQLVADAENIRATMKLDKSCPNLAVISLAHSYGFSNVVLPLLLQGHPLISVPDALPGSLRMAFAMGERLTLPAVPAMWRAWSQAGVLNDAPIALAISAGAPLPLEVERGVFEASGLKIHNFYGSSECGGIAYDRSAVPREDAAVAGTVMDGIELGVNQEGCLVVRGNNVAEGYWPTSDDSLKPGEFVTSDLAEIREGTVLMRGRVSDAINIAGRKLNPAEVEEALLSCEGVQHCVVFGVPSGDATRCEEVVACLNVRGNVTQQKLLHAAGSRLATWQLPRHIWLCEELEPSVRGKISRAEWRARWLSSQTAQRGQRQ